MKKLILSALAICAFSFSNAQETETTPGFVKGSKFVSGTLSYGSSETGNSQTSDFTVAPKFGYFVTNNIAVGAKIGLNLLNEDDATGNQITDANKFSAGLFGRYYVTPAAKFSVFAELGANYNTTDYKLGNFKEDGFDVSLAPGISYFISKSFALEAAWGVLGYETSKADFKGAESKDNLNFDLKTSDLSLGFVYKF